MRTHRPFPVLGIALTLVLVAAVAPAPGVGAQAGLVSVVTRTAPQSPEAGEDVVVKVRANGCPAGNALWHIYLTSNDGSSTNAALMVENTSRPTVLFRIADVMTLEDPPPGWYGVRVVCGQFRPARQPLAGTRFRVGSADSVEFELASDTVDLNGVLGISGSGCSGETVELDIRSASLARAPFLVREEIAVNEDGTWASLIDVPQITGVGASEVRARCVLRNQMGEIAYLNYDGSQVFTIITPAAEAEAAEEGVPIDQ